MHKREYSQPSWTYKTPLFRKNIYIYYYYYVELSYGRFTAFTLGFKKIHQLKSMGDLNITGKEM